MKYNIYNEFPLFYQNPAIQKLKDIPKWSVSDKNKRPIDMFLLQTQQQISGCDVTMPGAMCTLAETINILETPANHAFYLDVLEENVIIVDIEKICNPLLYKELMKLPYLYAEKSMSGRGAHLIMPLPRNFDEYPIAQTKVALKEPSGQFELLLNHWVTFTRNVIKTPTAPNGINTNGSYDKWDEIYKKLAENATKTHYEQLEYTETKNIADIPKSDEILDLLVNKNPYRKSPSDFTREDGSPDMSRYEAGFLTTKYINLLMILNTTIADSNYNYTLSDHIAILAETAKLGLSHRDKHDTYRNKLPYLTYIAKQTVERYQAKQVELKEER